VLVAGQMTLKGTSLIPEQVATLAAVALTVGLVVDGVWCIPWLRRRRRRVPGLGAPTCPDSADVCSTGSPTPPRCCVVHSSPRSTPGLVVAQDGNGYVPDG
jgi:hypothetical protein